MATMYVTLTMKWAWWVTPYTIAVKLFLWTVVPFMDDDDERLDAFLVRQVEFICTRGLKFYCNGKRV